MLEHSETISKLAQAIGNIQGAVGGIPKDSTNPHFRTKYPSLESVFDTIRGPMARAGLSFIQAPGEITEAGMLKLTTMIVHASGEWVRSTLHIPVVKRDPQGVGSTVTYACRYSIMAMLGLAPTDDDGQSATVRNGKDDAAATSAALATELIRELRACRTIQELKLWVESPAVSENIHQCSEADRARVRTDYGAHMRKLKSQETDGEEWASHSKQ